MRRCLGLGQFRRRWLSTLLQPHVAGSGRGYSEYAPAAPSPSDLKRPLPEKFSVGKNLKLKAVLIQYEILAGSDAKQARATSSSSPSSSSGSTAATPSSASSSSRNSGGFQPLGSSDEKLVDEISGLLGGGSLQGVGRKLVADLKSKMGAVNTPPATPTSSPGVQQRQQPGNAKGSDPKAKYMEKGAGDLLTYIAARSVRLGVIAGPRTTPEEFDNFVKQLRQQSIRVTVAVPPEVVELDGMEAGVERAGRELGAGEDGGRAANVLVVGSSEPLLSAATAAEMFTARFHPLNSRREGVIQTFTVRSIDEVRTVVEQINGTPAQKNAETQDRDARRAALAMSDPASPQQDAKPAPSPQTAPSSAAMPMELEAIDYNNLPTLYKLIMPETAWDAMPPADQHASVASMAEVHAQAHADAKAADDRAKELHRAELQTSVSNATTRQQQATARLTKSRAATEDANKAIVDLNAARLAALAAVNADFDTQHAQLSDRAEQLLASGRVHEADVQEADAAAAVAEETLFAFVNPEGAKAAKKAKKKSRGLKPSSPTAAVVKPEKTIKEEHDDSDTDRDVFDPCSADLQPPANFVATGARHVRVTATDTAFLRVPLDFLASSYQWSYREDFRINIMDQAARIRSLIPPAFREGATLTTAVQTLHDLLQEGKQRDTITSTSSALATLLGTLREADANRLMDADWTTVRRTCKPTKTRDRRHSTTAASSASSWGGRTSSSSRSGQHPASRDGRRDRDHDSHRQRDRSPRHHTPRERQRGSTTSARTAGATRQRDQSGSGRDSRTSGSTRNSRRHQRAPVAGDERRRHHSQDSVDSQGFSRAEPGKISAAMEAASRAARRKANKADPDSRHNRQKAARADRKEKERAAKNAAIDGSSDDSSSGSSSSSSSRDDGRDTSSRELLTDLFPTRFTSSTMSPVDTATAAATDANEGKPTSAQTLGGGEPELNGRSANAMAATATRLADGGGPPPWTADLPTTRSKASFVSDGGGHGVVAETQVADVAGREREIDLEHALDRLVSRLAQSQERVKFLEGNLEQAKHVESGRNALVKQITRLEEDVKHAHHRLEIHRAEALERREKRQALEAENERLGAELHRALGRNTRLETESRRKDTLLAEARKSADVRAESSSAFEAELRHKDQLLAEAERDKRQAWQATSASAETAKAASTRAEAAVVDAGEFRILRGDAGGQHLKRPDDENIRFASGEEHSYNRRGQSLTDVMASTRADDVYRRQEKTRRSSTPAETTLIHSVPLAEKYGDRYRMISHSPEMRSTVDCTVDPPNEAVYSGQDNGASRVIPPQAAVTATDYRTPRTTFFDDGGSDRNAWGEEDKTVLSPLRESQEPTTNKVFLSPESGRRMRVVETPPPAARAVGREQCYDGDRQRHDSEGVRGALTGANPAWTDAPSSFGGGSPITVGGGHNSSGGGAANVDEFTRAAQTRGLETRGGGRLGEKAHEEFGDHTGKFSTWVDARDIVEAGLRVEGDGAPTNDETSPASRGWTLQRVSPECPAAGHRRGRDMMSSRRSSLCGAGVGVSEGVEDGKIETSTIGTTGGNIEQRKASLNVDPAYDSGAAERSRRDRRASAPFATDAAEEELRPVREVERRLMLLQMEMSQLEAEQNKLVPKASKTMQARVELQKLDSRIALLASESSGLRRILRERPWGM
eukprot:g4654.t2